jgi:hypothetical protein
MAAVTAVARLTQASLVRWIRENRGIVTCDLAWRPGELYTLQGAPEMLIAPSMALSVLRGRMFAREKRTIAAVIACLAVVALSSCSGAKSRKAPGPADSEARGEPCHTECCCRTVDGYYHRFACTTKVECESQAGECREPDASRCRH